MVKGLSRRVVMVRYPEAGVFEQALFVVRDDASVSRGVTADDVLAEACRIAQRQTGANKRKRWPPLAYALLGAGSVGLAWGLSLWLG
ncbi:MAG: phage tail protein [Oscillospiraceae bacterium]|nr:phage tail protein [Oscillospiraceae bacterium]